jgi:hypothetical protein
VARIQKMFGRQPAAPTADVRASMTAEGEVAAAPQGINDIMVQARNYAHAVTRADPTKTFAAAQQEYLDAYLSKIKGRPETSRLYVSPDGKQRDYFIPGQQPTDWQAAGGGKTYSEDEISAFANNAVKLGFGGARIPTQAMGQVQSYMAENNMEALDTTRHLKAFGRDARGNWFSFLVSAATNQPIAGTVRADEPPPGYLPHETSGTYFTMGADGQLHGVPYTRESRAILGASVALSPELTGTATPAPAGLTTPAGAPPARVNQPAPSAPPAAHPRQQTGTPFDLGLFKGNTPQLQAISKYSDAKEISDLADRVAKTKDQSEARVLIRRLTGGKDNAYYTYIYGPGYLGGASRFYHDVFGPAISDDIIQNAVRDAHEAKDQAESKLRQLKVPTDYWGGTAAPSPSPSTAGSLDDQIINGLKALPKAP